MSKYKFVTAALDEDEEPKEVEVKLVRDSYYHLVRLRVGGVDILSLQDNGVVRLYPCPGEDTIQKDEGGFVVTERW